MLTLGGYINIIIAFGHIVGLFWAKKMFEATQIGETMNRLEKIHPNIPHILTIAVASGFFIFGLYGLSADGIIQELPYLKTGTFAIGAVYMLRGLGVLIYRAIAGSYSSKDVLFSTIAVFIGFLFLLGGFNKWIQ